MAIVRGLCSLAEARDSIFLATASVAPTGQDSVIEDYISAATNVIERLPDIGPQYAESRTLTFDGGKRELVLPFKFNAVTSITVDGTTVTGYVANGPSGIISADSAGWGWFNWGRQNVVVVVTVGNSTIPPNVKMAARELVTHWWRNGHQGNRPSFGDSSTDPAVQFGVPTRRLMELLGTGTGVPGFA